MEETGWRIWIVKREREETTVFANETRPAAADPPRSECKTGCTCSFNAVTTATDEQLGVWRTVRSTMTFDRTLAHFNCMLSIKTNSIS